MGLANSPWPKFQRDSRNTGISSYSGPSSPNLKWKYLIGDQVGPPVVGFGEVVYVGSNDGYLYALNPDGTLKLKVWIGDFVHKPPAIDSNGVIYAGTHQGKLCAVNPDGTLKWAYQTGNYSFSAPAIAADGTVYFGSRDNYLYAFNPNGTLKWRFNASDWVDECPPIGEDGTLYIGAHAHCLHAINPDGTSKWTSEDVGSWIRSSAIIGSDGTIYAHAGDTGLVAINPHGTIKWVNYEARGGGDEIFTPAIGPDGTIYLADFSLGLYAVNPDGTLKWRYNPGGYILSQTCTVDSTGVVYIIFNSTDFTRSYLRAINPDGTLKWEFEFGGLIANSPAIGADGTIYIGSGDGYVYAFGTAKLPLQCDPPVIIEPDTARCARPMIILQAPTPADPLTGPAEWRLHFKIQSYADAGGTLLINQVDSSINPELFKYSSDGGLTWRNFPADGLPREQYGALVWTRVEVGPRTKVWLKASVGAEDV